MSERLTAEQVREAVEANSWGETSMNHSSWQAIADDLNKALDGSECEKLPSLTDTVCIVRRGGMEMEFSYWRCSKCGCENFEGAKHCMNCGAKVVEKNER